MSGAKKSAHNDDSLFGKKWNSRNRTDPFDGAALPRRDRLNIERIAIGFFKKLAQSLAPEELFRSGQEYETVGLTLRGGFCDGWIIRADALLSEACESL